MASLIFFAWGGVSYSALLIVSIIFNYLIGRRIAVSEKAKVWLLFGVIINISLLGVFKYAGLFTETINVFLGLTQNSLLPIPEILLPIGISFYTFQAMSYLIDIYRKEAEVQKNIANLGLYISLFPQLIAGPIVRYHDISLQINNRAHTYEKFSEGVLRFVLGLAKKTLIANNLAIVADQVFNTPAGEISTLAAWIGIIAYTFQIYYDFAGYSDMAIGLAKMFGFDLLENFNFPYISKSIQEFWRRWHISLSSWFRDYLYIPLGGNRIGVKRTYVNLFIVFFVTGLWHGSSWNFVVWGLIHGLFIVIERLGFKNTLKKLPALFSGTYTLFIAMMAWVLFRAEDFGFAKEFYMTLFGFSNTTDIDVDLALMINSEFVLSLMIAIFGAFGGFMLIKKQLLKTLSTNLLAKLKPISYSLFIIIIMILVTTYLANSTYNPFIYFRF
ncbi:MULTISPECIES: MBOAT family protein [unclassified Lentimicrobium]|uniref:MBOAT family O-acyltransferase n=1 Tax=unclassified Lentimicrobium TaxID=2677434 RepID=UPI001C1327B6|nr:MULTISPECIES: MBOAT family O-acyltransferase [unclassified Lentimicrobium]